MDYPQRNWRIWAGGLLVVLPMIFLGACSPSVSKEDAPDLIILQTGRLRGNVVPESFKNAWGTAKFFLTSPAMKKVRDEARKT